MLTVSHLRKTFGSLVAVDDVGLEHEMVGVVGAHGEEPAAELFR